MFEIELFVIIGDRIQPLTAVRKSSILDVAESLDLLNVIYLNRPLK